MKKEEEEENRACATQDGWNVDLLANIGRLTEMEGRDAPHVDYLTDNLGAFLGDVLEAIGRAAEN